MATAFFSYEIATSATSVGQLTLSELRTIVRNVCLNRPDLNDSAGSARIDRAIKMAGDEFVRRTRNTRTVDDSVSFSTTDGTASLSSITDTVDAWTFVEGQVIGTATTADVSRIDYRSLTFKRQEQSYVDDNYFFAFKDDSTVQLDRTPSESLTFRIVYSPYFTDFTIGSSTPGDVTFNVADRYLQQIANLGAAMYLAREVQDLTTFEDLRQEWEAWLRSCAGEEQFEGSRILLDTMAYEGRG